MSIAYTEQELYNKGNFAPSRMHFSPPWIESWRHRFFVMGQPGWGYPSYASPLQEGLLQVLKADADWLKGQWEAIDKRIEALEKRFHEDWQPKP